MEIGKDTSLKRIVPHLPVQAATLVALCKSLLGSDLVGVYLHGSFIGGGLRPLSDLDFLVVSKHRLSDFRRSLFLSRLLKLSARHPSGAQAPRCLDILMICAGDLRKPSYPARCEFIYGEWLRAGFEHGEKLMPLADPVVTLMIAQARPEAIALHGAPLDHLMPRVPALHVPCALLESLHPLLDTLIGDERNVLLTLARMWRTATTGEFVAKDVAAFWAADQLPASVARTIRNCGLAYQGRYADDWRMYQKEVREAADTLRDILLAALQTGSSYA